jgi:hypothetical protein
MCSATTLSLKDAYGVSTMAVWLHSLCSVQHGAAPQLHCECRWATLLFKSLLVEQAVFPDQHCSAHAPREPMGLLVWLLSCSHIHIHPALHNMPFGLSYE